MKIDGELLKCLAKFEGPIDNKTLIAQGRAHSNRLWRILEHIPFTKHIAERHFLEKSQKTLSYLEELRLDNRHITVASAENHLPTDKTFFLQPLFTAVGRDSPELNELTQKTSNHRALAELLQGLSKSELDPIVKYLASLPKEAVDASISAIHLAPGEKLTMAYFEPQIAQPTNIWEGIQGALKTNPCAFFIPTLPPVLKTISPHCSESDLAQLPDALNGIGPLFTEISAIHHAIDNIHLLEKHPDGNILSDILQAKGEASTLTHQALSLLKTRIQEAKTEDNWIQSGIKEVQQNVQKARDLTIQYRTASAVTKLDFAHNLGEWDPLVLYLFTSFEAPAGKVDMLRRALHTTGLGFVIRAIASTVAAQLPGLITSYIDEMLKQIVQFSCQSKAKNSAPLDSKTIEQTEQVARLFSVFAPQMTQDLDLLLPILDYMSYLNKAMQQQAPINDAEFKTMTISALEAIGKLIDKSFLVAIEKGIQNAPKALNSISA